MNNTEERNDAFQNDTQKQRRQKITMLTNSQSTARSQNRNAERTTLKGETTLPETEKRHAETNANSASQNGTQKNDVNNDAHGNSQTTTRI